MAHLVQRSVYLPPELDATYFALANENDRSFPAQVRHALKAYLDDGRKPTNKSKEKI